MTTCERATTVQAPFETVWEFYDGVEELEVLTPEWVGLRIPRVVGPDGEDSPGGYLVGTRVHLQSRLLDLLPDEEWVVKVTEREVRENRAYFVDEQVGDHGPFEHWRHTHRFVGFGDETLVHDHVSYRLPSTDLPLATPLLLGMLWHRHRRTRNLLE